MLSDKIRWAPADDSKADDSKAERSRDGIPRQGVGKYIESMQTRCLLYMFFLMELDAPAPEGLHACARATPAGSLSLPGLGSEPLERLLRTGGVEQLWV